MKSAIKYFGGKSNMLTHIFKHFPKKGSYEIFIDLFGGSASVLLGKEPFGVEIYNDLEENVYSLYKVIADPSLFRQFKEHCDKAFYSEQLRNEFKQSLKNGDLSIVDRAFQYFYVNRTSHNGMGGFSSNCIVRRGMSKSTSDFLSCVDRLPEMHDRLSRVIIMNRDAFDILEKYKDDENVFIYADPPYHHSTRTSTRYKVDFSDEQHTRFLDIIINAKCKILISGYACEEYRRLDDSTLWITDCFEVKTIDGNHQPKTKKECLWKNYDLILDLTSEELPTSNLNLLDSTTNMLL